MKAVTRTLFACSLIVIVALLFCNTDAVAQDKMTMDEYRALLQQWTDREAAAKSEIATLDAEIAALKSQIADTDGQTAATWAEIYKTIGVTEADVNAYREQLNDLDSQLNSLAALSPEELFKRRKELDDIDTKLGELKESRISALTEMQNKIAALEGKIAQLRAKMPKGMYDEYTVTSGDYLWRISKGQYGEGLQWMRIYSVNKEQIKDPDLIFPEQIFKIHRENSPSQYLVSPGDNLFKISGSMDVMGDPTKWRELYDANKDVIGEDTDMIYPYSVLTIPGK